MLTRTVKGKLDAQLELEREYAVDVCMMDVDISRTKVGAPDEATSRTARGELDDQLELERGHAADAGIVDKGLAFALRLVKNEEDDRATSAAAFGDKVNEVAE